MEKLILGQKEMKIDAKGRVFIPSQMDVWKGTEIVFARLEGSYYHLYILETINKLVDELIKKKELAQNENQYRVILYQLNTLFDMIIDTSKIDSQRRVIVPTEIQELSNGSVLLQGQGDHIALFPNDEIYENYKKNNLSRELKL